MVFFLIFDILCLFASLGMSILVGLAITFWGPVSKSLEGENGNCINPPPPEPYDIGKNVFVSMQRKNGQYVSKLSLTSVQRNSKIASPNLCVSAHEKIFASIPELK